MGIILCKTEAETVHHISTNVVLQGHYTRGWLLAPIQICLWHRCWYALRNQIPGTVQEQDRNCSLRHRCCGGTATGHRHMVIEIREEKERCCSTCKMQKWELCMVWSE